MSFEAEALRGIFSDLVARLKPDNIVDKLYEAKLLTQAEYESLISREMKSDVRGVNRRILLAVSKGPVGSVVTFAEIVKSNDQSELAGEILRGKDLVRPFVDCTLLSIYGDRVLYCSSSVVFLSSQGQHAHCVFFLHSHYSQLCSSP